jgi:8-oxo-dGTP pyrophosphatase MutT (NUDIX family)
MIDANKIISTLLKNKLPGSASHQKMLPPNRILKAPTSGTSKIKYSSVLLLLFQENMELKACLIKRPQHMKHHAGQIALPGGKMEDGETDIVTALRETSEEIGVSADKIQILGKLTAFYVEVSCFQIQPIVGWLSHKPKVKLNPEEVEKVFFFPVHNFKPPYAHVQLETRTGNLNVPCIKYQREIIWGATAMILSEFYDVIKDELG